MSEITGTWGLTAAEMDLLGLRTGEVLGSAVVGFAIDAEVTDRDDVR